MLDLTMFDKIGAYLGAGATRQDAVMRRLKTLALGVLVAMVVAGCAGTRPSPPPTALPPSLIPDPVLAGAVADALATIDEIDRIYQHPSDAAFGLMADVARSGRASLAREPARITTMVQFHVYDLSLQLFEVNESLHDGAQMVNDHDWLMSANVRGTIAALGSQ